MVDVVIGDNHALFVDLLSGVLAGRGYEVIGTAPTARRLVEVVARHRPSLCLVDHRTLAGRDRGRLLTDLRASGPRTKFVVVSDGPIGPAADTAAALGVAGVIDKGSRLTTLLDGLHRVLEGEVVTATSAPSATVTPPAEARQRDTGGEAARRRRLAATLTARERECLALLVDGQTTPHIARTLSISVTTVRTHVRSLLSKLDVHSRLEAAALAVRYQVLVEEPDGYGAG